jgi:signal transduction histidine kinase
MAIVSEAMETATEPAQATVLVIDDDRGPRESLRILLKTEFRVLCAESVDLGVGLLREQQPDVVVMDIRMPGKSGIEGLRAIREIDRHVAVVMFTGFGALETAQEAIRLGANDYIKKPFDAFEMQAVVRRHAQRVQAERRHRQAEGELATLNEQLRAELARKEHLAALGQKSAELVHDLRNPLGAVLGYVDLLSADLRSSRESLGDHWQDTSEYLAIIEKSVLRCKDLSDMWLEASRGRMNLVPVRIADLIGEVVRDVEHLAAPRGIRVTADIQTPDTKTEADRLQLSRAILNLVVNAVEAVESERGLVRVRCRDLRPDTVEIVVEDNGCGMDAEQIRHVMEPFFTTKKSGGTGLGLFIARQVIESGGGTLTIDSEKGHGTRITVWLPKRAARPGPPPR